MVKRTIRYSIVQVERYFKSGFYPANEEILHQGCYYRILPTMPYTVLHSHYAEFQADIMGFIEKIYIYAIAEDMRRHNREVAYTVWKETIIVPPSTPSDPSEKRIEFEYVGIWDNEQAPPIVEEFFDPGEYAAWPP